MTDLERKLRDACFAARMDLCDGCHEDERCKVRDCRCYEARRMCERALAEFAVREREEAEEAEGAEAGEGCSA